MDNAQELESFQHFYGTLLRVPTQNSCSCWPAARVDNHDQVGVMVLSEVFSDLHNSSTYDNKGDVKVSHQS